MKRIGLTAFALALAATPAAPQDAPRELDSLFPRQAEIFVDRPGLARLTLPEEVVLACRPDLSDLRVVDTRGREVPFLVDSGLSPEVEIEARQRFGAEILGAERRTEAREGAPNRLIEVYELAVPLEPPADREWELVLESGADRFVRRVRVEVRSGDEPWWTLIEGESVFRLHEPRREKSRVAVPLPALAADRLRVTLEGDEEDFLEPVFRFEASRSIPGGHRALVELERLEVRQVDRRTEIVLARPRGLVPDLLVLETATGTFRRPVAAFDEGPGSAAGALAEGVLFRIERPVAVEELELAVRPARGDRLRLVIDDGDSPPLEGPVVRAAVRRPSLIFSLAAQDGAPAGRLLFGGGRAYRPEYDLAGLLPALPAAGEAAEIGERLYDPAELAVARLGSAAANPRFDPRPALAFAMRPGAPADPRPFSHLQRLRGEPSEEGLIRHRLPLDVLARARADLADLRVLDAQDRQWPFLLEREAAAESRMLPVDGPVSEDGVSRYGMGLPATPLAVAEISFDADAPFFDRQIRVLAIREGEKKEAVLERRRVAKRIGDPQPARIDLGGPRLLSLALEIEDGDDAPLRLTRVEARFPVAEIFFAAPAGDYSLLVGFPDSEAPSYELERVRNVVLAVAGKAAEAGPPTENPRFSARARLGTESGLGQLLLWAAIGVAVLILTVFTLRLARQES